MKLFTIDRSDARFQNGFSAGSCRKSYTFDSGYSTSDGDCRSQESQDVSKLFKYLYPVFLLISWHVFFVSV